MKKPRISDNQCKDLINLVHSQIPTWQKAMMGYGFGVLGMTSAVAITAFDFHPATAGAAFILIGVNHFLFRNKVGIVPSLSTLDQYDCSPDNAAMHEIVERFRRTGIALPDEEFPALAKIGLIKKAVQRIENARSISCSIAGYFSLLSVALLG